MIRAHWRCLASLAVSAALGCGGGGDSTSPDPTVATVSIAPPALTVPVGGQGTLTAELRDANGAIVSGATTSWVSRGSSIASVNGSGVVTGQAEGEAIIVATSGNAADSIVVTVVDDLTLEVTPPNPTIAVGETQQFAVTARNGVGQVIATPPVTWKSSDTAVATIDANGLASGRFPGKTEITATAGQVVSPPDTLTVLAGGSCASIASVPSWDATMQYNYMTDGQTRSNSVERACSTCGSARNTSSRSNTRCVSSTVCPACTSWRKRRSTCRSATCRRVVSAGQGRPLGSITGLAPGANGAGCCETRH